MLGSEYAFALPGTVVTNGSSGVHACVISCQNAIQGKLDTTHLLIQCVHCSGQQQVLASLVWTEVTSRQPPRAPFHSMILAT